MRQASRYIGGEAFTQAAVRRASFPFFCLLFCLLLTGLARAASGEAGKIITLTPGVFVERDGVRTPLALNDPVLDTDTIITDAAGRARILFHDDGAVALGPNTSLALVEVLPEGKTPTFKAHVSQGVARFITGRIVEQNPKGFAVSTPEGTAGIRGTIFVLQTGNGRTTLYVVNAARDVALNNVSVPSGFKMTLPGGNPLPMTPADVSLTQTVAAAPASSTGNSTPEQASLAVPDASGPLAPPPADLLVSDMATSPLPSTPPPFTPPPSTGYVSGTLYTTAPGVAFSSDSAWHFTLDLHTGAISNASSSGSYADSSSIFNVGWDFVGGSGSFSGGTFWIHGFTGQITNLLSPSNTYPSTSAYMSHDPNLDFLYGPSSFANVGDSVHGLHVISADPAVAAVIYGGPFQAYMTGSRKY